MPWEDEAHWEEDLHQLAVLSEFLLRSWRPLGDFEVRRWLIFSPASLKRVRVWSGARNNMGRQVEFQSEDAIHWEESLSYDAENNMTQEMGFE